MIFFPHPSGGLLYFHGRLENTGSPGIPKSLQICFRIGLWLVCSYLYSLSFNRLVDCLIADSSPLSQGMEKIQISLWEHQPVPGHFADAKPAMVGLLHAVHPLPNFHPPQEHWIYDSLSGLESGKWLAAHMIYRPNMLAVPYMTDF